MFFSIYLWIIRRITPVCYFQFTATVDNAGFWRISVFGREYFLNRVILHYMEACCVKFQIEKPEPREFKEVLVTEPETSETSTKVKL